MTPPLFHIGEVVATRDLARLRNMTSVASMDANYGIAARAARLQLTDERLPPEFDLPPRHMAAIDAQS